MTIRQRLFSMRPVVAVVIGGVVAVLGRNIGVGIGAAAIALAALLFVGPRPPAAVGTRPSDIDPFGVGEPWRQMVQRAVRAEREYATTAASVSGPVGDYLKRVGAQLQLAVQDAWSIAQSGDFLDQSIRDLRPTRLRAELAQLESSTARRALTRGDDQDGDDTVAADNQSSITSLRSQLDTVERLQAQSAQTAAQLRAGVTRLGELVTHATEVAVGNRAQNSYTAEVDDLVTSLEALRQAAVELPPS